MKYHSNKRLRIFRYIPELDAFAVTDEYGKIAAHLGLVEWNPVVWIGRLFTMDNDFGEHWFDNWELREAKAQTAEKLGFNLEKLYFIDPKRFCDGKDGPCHSDESRQRFWMDVLTSLELSYDMLFAEARVLNSQYKAALNENSNDPDYKLQYIPDLEQRIAALAG